MQIGIGLNLTRGGGAAPWTPASLASTVVWWDASQGITESGGLVSSWADRVGAQTITQASGTLKPVYSATSLNGYPGLTFDGTDDTLARASIPTGVPTGTSDGWMMILADQVALVADATARAALAYGGVAGTDQRNLFRLVGGGINRAEVDNGTTGSTETTINFSGVSAVIGTFTSGTSWQARINGTDATAVTADTYNTATTRLRVGANSAAAAAFFFNGVFGHVLIGTGTLTTGQKEQLEAWALWSVGQQAKLPGGHTYKNRRP